MKTCLCFILVSFLFACRYNKEQDYRPSPAYFDEMRHITYKKINDSLYICQGYSGFDMGAYGAEDISMYLVDSNVNSPYGYYYGVGTLSNNCLYKIDVLKNKVKFTFYLELNASDTLVRELYYLNEKVPYKKNYYFLLDTLSINLDAKKIFSLEGERF